MQRKIVAPFDITKLKRCPYCGSTDIGHNQGLYYLNPEAGAGYTNEWYCNYCGERWED